MTMQNTAAAKSVARNMSDEIFEDLRRRIISCELEPGSKINIRSLCATLDLNPGAMREALSRLSAEGLVDAFARRGYAVASVSAEDLLQLTEARIEIERDCLVLAIERGGIEWETAVVAALHRLNRTPYNEPGSKLLDPRWVKAHSEFHRALVSACGNHWMLRLRAQLYDQSERYRQFSVPLAREVRDVKTEHSEIADAVLAREVEKSTRLIEAHFKKTTQIIVDALSSRT
jgi:DNA-binding GntR family transcriptional regulator